MERRTQLKAGDDAIEQKIVPLDRRADGAGNHGPAQLRAVISLRQRASWDVYRCHDDASSSRQLRRRRGEGPDVVSLKGHYPQRTPASLI